MTTYTYDPSGTPSASGAANEWPFQYQGMEKEFTDPGPYYYSGSGQFYSPQFIRSLSEAGQTSSSQGACPSGNAIGAPSDSSGSGFNFPSGVLAAPENSSEGQTGRTTITVTGAAGAGATIGAIIGAAVGAPLAGAVIGGAVGAIVGGIASVFEELFGGGAPPSPRQLLHGRHPLYPTILGFTEGETPGEASAAFTFSGPGSSPPNFSPLLNVQWEIVPEPEVPAEPQSLPQIPPGEDIPLPPFSTEPTLTPDQYQRCLNAAVGNEGDWNGFCGSLPTNRMRRVCRDANFQSAENKTGVCKYLRGFIAGPMACR